MHSTSITHKAPAAGAFRPAPRSAVSLHLTSRSVRCQFATVDVAHYLQLELNELQIEGVMHVSAAQAGACMERFGDIEAAPSVLPPLDDVLTPPTAQQQQQLSGLARAGSGTDRVVSEAFCLATPPDNPQERENNNPVRQVQGRAAVSNTANSKNTARSNILSFRGSRVNSTANPLRSLEAEEALSFETAAAYQRAALCVYSSEALQASAAIRRQRRRAMIRLLRASRARTAASLSALASIADTISSSLASADGEDA